jgi:hypothetical protein
MMSGLRSQVRGRRGWAAAARPGLPVGRPDRAALPPGPDRSAVGPGPLAPVPGRGDGCRHRDRDWRHVA